MSPRPTTPAPRVALAELAPYPGNPRVHDLDALRASIRTHGGQYRAIVIASDGVILAGHGTAEALALEGYTDAAVTRVPYPSTDPRARVIVLGDNRLQERAGYDDHALAEMLQRLEDDLEGTGWDEAAVAGLLRDLATPELAPSPTDAKAAGARRPRVKPSAGSSSPPTPLPELTRRAIAQEHIDAGAYRGEPVTIPADYAELPIDTVVTDPDGRPRLAYLHAPHPEHERLRAALRRMRFTPHKRVNGLMTNARSFGYLPRVPMRRDWCSPAEVNRDTEAFKLLADWAPILEAGYQALIPDLFEKHRERAQAILENWRLPSAVCFTGGTLNRDASIGWHHDRGNFADSWSAMPCLRAGIEGGALVIPEFRLWLPIEDGSVTYFDGQALLHAVTPLRKTARDGHRLTAVYYSLTQLWSCLAPDAEVDRAQARYEDRGRRRAQGAEPRADVLAQVRRKLQEKA